MESQYQSIFCASTLILLSHLFACPLDGAINHFVGRDKEFQEVLVAYYIAMSAKDVLFATELSQTQIAAFVSGCSPDWATQSRLPTEFMCSILNLNPFGLYLPQHTVQYIQSHIES